MYEMSDFYFNLGYSTEIISTTINSSILDRYSVVMCGIDGTLGEWTVDEINALENFIQNGGIFVGMIKSAASSGVETLANRYNISFISPVGNSGLTSIVDTDHPLMNNVSSFYLSSFYSSLSISSPAKGIIWDSSATGIYGAFAPIGLGNILILSFNIYEQIYEADHVQFLKNILDWGFNNLRITSSDYTNSDYNFTWDYNLAENEQAVLSQVFVDGVHQGNSLGNNFSISALSEW